MELDQKQLNQDTHSSSQPIPAGHVCCSHGSCWNYLFAEVFGEVAQPFFMQAQQRKNLEKPFHLGQVFLLGGNVELLGHNLLQALLGLLQELQVGIDDAACSGIRASLRALCVSQQAKQK